MSSHCQFEAELKWDCIVEIVKTIRSGDMNRSKALSVVKHASCFLGSAATLLDGSPEDDLPDNGGDPDVVISFGSLPKGINTIADELEDCCNKAYSANNIEGSGAWKDLLRTVVPILLQLLAKFL